MVEHPRDFVVWLEHSVGPVGEHLYFFEDGSIQFVRLSRSYRRKLLEPRDSRRVMRILDSVEFEQAISSLRESGYRPGCCDTREVAIQHHPDGDLVGYSACREAGKETALAQFVRLANEIGRRYYPRTFEALPVLACGQ